ncbi:hypothetical protein [Paenibacillus mesotrionivorans]|uniref:Uncharacterized protein n=1 Tax=Paenibacillus mesotrionivorans TaxID=3160968 RepID=A0ACC7NXB2_9BACL
MTDKMGDDNMINKKQSVQTTTVTNAQATAAAKKQFDKYRETFKKLAKN